MGLNNFILNCEKENKKLEENIEYYKNKSERLQQRIDKAIEYINTSTIDPRSCYHFRDTIYSILQAKEMK